MRASCTVRVADHLCLALQYKMRLSKAEVASFHRPAMQFPINVPIMFSRLTSSRKKREDRGKAKKGKDPSEILRSSRDLTLSDTGPYVMYEYSVCWHWLLISLSTVTHRMPITLLCRRRRLF